MFIADERSVFLKEIFFAEFFDHFDRCIIQWNIPFAGSTFELADFDLRRAVMVAIPSPAYSADDTIGCLKVQAYQAKDYILSDIPSPPIW